MSDKIHILAISWFGVLIASSVILAIAGSPLFFFPFAALFGSLATLAGLYIIFGWLFHRFMNLK